MLHTRSLKESKIGDTLLAALEEMPAAVRAVKFYSVSEVAAMISPDPKQLHRARAAQQLAIDNGTRIEPGSLESISCVSVGKGRFEYSAEAIHNYLRGKRAQEKERELKIQALTGLNAVLAFQTWLCEASPMDTWPFSIQADGRPIDLCAAIIADKLTGEAERLTLREFGERAADAASRAFHRAEAEALDGVVVVVAERTPAKGL